MNLAPIILFVYNRPWHTEQTLEALSQNDLANESVLYIYCDGPKKNIEEKELIKIEEVRRVIRKQQWCKEVIIKERTENKGLASSIIQGVNEVINKHGKIIVLEDDIVTSIGFLKYMNDGLNLYENENLVYGISGYCFPSSKKIKQHTYFLPIMSSWGYGTWQNRWNSINFNGIELLSIVEKNGINHKLDFGRLKYYQMLIDQVGGKNDSWAVRFYVSMFLNKGVFLYPNISLLKNIGFDGTGVHCGNDDEFHENNFERKTYLNISKTQLVLNTKILRLFSFSEKTNSILKFKKKIKNILPLELLHLYRRKFGVKSNEFGLDLKLFPRYTKTRINFLGKQISIPDSASFLFIQKEIFVQQIYKFKTDKENPYIIDAGANIGLATLYFKKLYPEAHIVAFEPDENIFNFLEENINLFELKNVHLVKKGLWNSICKLSFASEGADGGCITSKTQNETETVMIEVVSLKPYLQVPVDFLKIDIEGAETVVLKDIQEDLVRVERIFVEYHSFVGQRQTLNEIIDILTNANFRLYISSPGLMSKSPFVKINTYNNMDMQLNIYGIKE